MSKLELLAPASIELPVLRLPPRPEILVRNKWVPEELQHRMRKYNPRTDLGKLIKDSFHLLPAEQAGALLDQLERMIVLESSLSLRVHRLDKLEDLGEVSRKVITTAGVNFLVDAWQGSVEMEILRYHGFGSGTSAEAVGNTALVTEFTTEYAVNSTRPTGTLTEGASANIFRTVATFAPDATVSVEEHGIFSQAATGGGTLWDRSLTGTVSLTASVDSLEATYDMTASSGG